MFPHNAQEFGWYKAESPVVVRISQDNHHAIGGVVTGSKPSFHKLGANTSMLTCWEDCQRCQPSCRNGGSPRPSPHPRIQRAYPYRLGTAGGHALSHTPLSAAAGMMPESASPSGCSPPVNYSPRICPAVSSHSNSDVTPPKNRRKVSLTKRRMFLPRALVMRVSVR